MNICIVCHSVFKPSRVFHSMCSVKCRSDRCMIKIAGSVKEYRKQTYLRQVSNPLWVLKRRLATKLWRERQLVQF